MLKRKKRDLRVLGLFVSCGTGTQVNFLSLKPNSQPLQMVFVFVFVLINLFILLIYFWLCRVFVAASRLSLVAASGGYSLLWCTGFSLQWLLLLQSTGSRCVGLSSCGTWAQ